MKASSLCRKIKNRLKPPAEVRHKYERFYESYSSYTRIIKPHYLWNCELASSVSTLGDIVECGVWKGGMMAGIAEIMGPDRHYHLFDSFEGLPDVTEIDGESAATWMKTNDIAACKTEERFAAEAMCQAGAENTNIVKGWFNDTLQTVSFPRGIALLRLDADWYSSTAECLNVLYEKVNVGGMIIFDDYFAWDGCSKALHDFLSMNKLADRIRVKNGEVCYLIKESLSEIKPIDSTI